MNKLADPEKVTYDPPSGEGRIPAQARHKTIMDAFKSNNFVSVSEIASRVGVSTMTIRRDLMHLERMGKITRTHGGAVAPADETGGAEEEELRFDRRLTQNSTAKTAIARLAAGLVGPGQAVGLDTGSTVLAVAQFLSKRDDLMLFTTNLRAALAQAQSKNRLYIVGGETNTTELSVIGLSATKTIRSHFLDVTFLGVSALDENGIYDFSTEDTEIKNAYIESSSRIIVLCDSSKFGRRALSRIVDLGMIDVLVTDAPPPVPLAQALKAAMVEVLIAEGVAAP